MISPLSIWRFARPHTIIGSTVSITTLYIMACNGVEFEHVPLLLLSILTGILCNIYIVGINQIEDIEIDKINKPFLPLASGELSISEGRWIIRSCFAGALILSFLISSKLILIVGGSMAIGWAYSRPPLYLRKHHLPAALAIASVRGILINLGGFYVFNELINGKSELSTDIIILCVFITGFSIVIAWFKDLPDVKGDSQFKINSIAVLYSQKTAMIAGHLLLIPSYVSSIILYSGRPLMSIGHIILLILFLANSIWLSFDRSQTYRSYYKRFWYLFFAEYVLYGIDSWG